MTNSLSYTTGKAVELLSAHLTSTHITTFQPLLLLIGTNAGSHRVMRGHGEFMISPYALLQGYIQVNEIEKAVTRLIGDGEGLLSA